MKKNIYLVLGIFSFLVLAPFVFSFPYLPNNTNPFNYQAKDFFPKLIESHSDLTSAYAIFEFKSPIQNIRANMLGSHFARNERIKSININSLQYFVLNNISYSVPIYTKTLVKKTCTRLNNATGLNETYDCSYYKRIKTGTQIKYKTKWIPLKKNFIFLPFKTYKIKVVAHYKADLGKRAIDWIPYINVNNKKLLRKEWTWWNSSWSKKRPINVSVSSGSTQANYQVKLNITYDSDMNANFSDLRFVNGSENTELPYWIENKSDSNWALVWVKVDQNITTSNYTFYMYYGNPSATNKSNGTATFEAFDTFNDGSLSDWTIDSGTWTEQNGILNNSVGSSASFIHYSAMNNLTNYSIRVDWKVDSGDTTRGDVLPRFIDTSNQGDFNLVSDKDTVYAYKQVSGTYTQLGSVAYTLSANTWYHTETIAIGDTIKIYFSGSLVLNVSDSVFASGGALEKGVAGLRGAPNTVSVNNLWDNFSVRKYHDPEPTYTIGAEEAQPVTTSFTVTSSSPVDTAITNDLTQDFSFTVSGTESTYNCSLYINNTIYGTNDTTYNNTQTTITSNTLLNNNTYNWYINCTNNSISNTSETRTIYTGPGFTTCGHLITSDTTYYLTSNILNSSATTCLEVYYNSPSNITLNCLSHKVDGVDTSSTYGIKVERPNITIRNCTISDWDYGIAEDTTASGNLTVLDSIVVSNGDGFAINLGKNNTFKNNNVSFNSYGFFLENNEYNTIVNNTINSNTNYGIEIYVSDRNTLHENKIENNVYAIYDLGGISGWLVYNNLFNSSKENIYLTGTNANDWNTTQQAGTRIYSNGTDIGGNFWAYTNGSGFSETCNDTNHTGFCDDYYNLTNNNIDWLPYSLKYNTNQNYSRTGSLSFLLSQSPTRKTTLHRTPSLTTLLSDTSARLSSFTHNIFSNLINTLTRTFYLTATRHSTQSTTLLTTPSKTSTANRQASLTTTLSNIPSRLKYATRQTSLAFIIIQSTHRLASLLRNPYSLLTASFSTQPQLTATRLPTQTTTLTTTQHPTTTLTRKSTNTLFLSSISTRLTTLARHPFYYLTATLSSSPLTHLFRHTNNPLALSLLPTRHIKAERTTPLTATLSTSSSRTSYLTRNPLYSISFNAITQRISSLFRHTNQPLTSTPLSVRTKHALRHANQPAYLTTNSTQQYGFVRTASLALLSTFSQYTQSVFSRSSLLTNIFTSTTQPQLIAIRQGNEPFTTTPSINIKSTLNRLASLSSLFNNILTTNKYMTRKNDLLVFIYHSNSRLSNLARLSTFTFSTLPSTTRNLFAIKHPSLSTTTLTSQTQTKGMTRTTTQPISTTSLSTRTLNAIQSIKNQISITFNGWMQQMIKRICTFGGTCTSNVPAATTRSGGGGIVEKTTIKTIIQKQKIPIAVWAAISFIVLSTGYKFSKLAKQHYRLKRKIRLQKLKDKKRQDHISL